MDNDVDFVVHFDRYDEYVLGQSGNAQDLIFELYNDKISQNNAEKQLAGIRRHLDHKKQLALQNIGMKNEDELEAKLDKNEWIARKTIRLNEEEKDDAVAIMNKMGLDPIQWKCNWFKRKLSDWQVTIKNKAWEGEQYLNRAYSCEVSVSPKQDIITSEGIRQIFEGLEPPKLEDYHNEYDSDLCLALALLDNHFGKEGMSLEDQTELYRKSVEDILGQVNDYGIKLDSSIVQIGQDHWHIDGSGKQTTSGTRMETNDKWSNIYKVGVDNIFWTIEQLRKVSNTVYVYYVPGNHDKTLGLAATYHFEKVYEDRDDVIVDSSDYPRKYHQHGSQLIAMTHGRDEGKQRIKTIMQAEADEMWGNTKFREFLLGDLHHEEAEEEGGIVRRRISAITHLDGWHIDKGYTTAVRKAQSFLYHRERGKRLTIDSNVEIGVSYEESGDRL